MPTGPKLFAEAEKRRTEAVTETGDERTYQLLQALVAAVQANTAVQLMIAENQHDFPPYETDAWREVLPQPPLRECRNKEARRPECAELHTEDCQYADPPPEPKHVLLDVGTRVLVDPLHDPDCVCASTQPYAGKIAGYDMHRSKYQINEECYGRPGEYYDFVKWEFVGNRVQVHPEGPECPPPPKPVKREPTGPVVYVENKYGKQGRLIEVYHHEKDDSLWYTVQFFSPGAEPVKKRADSLTVIAASQVERCPNGQTRDDCGSGENQCEPCLADEDEEADAIEESMGLHESPHSPGCPPINHRH